MIERFKTWHSCLSLKTGAIILGIVWIVGCIFSIIIRIDSQVHSSGYKKGSGCLSPMEIILLLLLVLLMIGAIKNNFKVVTPWLIVNIIAMPIKLLCILASAEFICREDLVRKYLLVGMFEIAAISFLWFVPYNYYQKLKEQQRKEFDMQGEAIYLLSHI